MKTIALAFLLFAQSTYADTPNKALRDYKKSAQSQDFESAWKHAAKFEGSPKEVNEYLRHRVQRFMKLASRGWDIEILEEKIVDDCAIVVVNSVVDASNDDEWEKGAKAKFDPSIIYLTKQNGKWKVFPPAHGLKAISKYIAKDKLDIYKNLEAWFKARKLDLTKDKGEQDVAPDG